MTWGLCFSFSQAMATDVSRPPEYASTIRSILLTLHPFVELARERLRLAVAAADHEDVVVAADRADHLRQAGAVDRFGERLRLRRLGPQHDKLLDDVELPQEAGDGALEDSPGVGRHGRVPDHGTLVSPVGRSLDQPPVADSARHPPLAPPDPSPPHPLPH